MPGLVGLLGVLLYNYARHRRHLPTICSTTRRYLPPWAVVVGWSALTGYMLPHLLRGYVRDRLKETA